MNKELVNFPSPTDGWRDSYEGGIFTMLVVPEPEGWANNCCVDVNILLTAPDCPQNPSDLWEPYDHEVKIHAYEVYQYLSGRAGDTSVEFPDARQRPVWARGFRQGFRYREWANWAIRARGPESLSAGVLAAMQLGSSQFSLWSDEQGRYWTASKDDLTPAGTVLYDSLASAYGIKPLLLTFLDT